MPPSLMFLPQAIEMATEKMAARGAICQLLCIFAKLPGHWVPTWRPARIPSRAPSVRCNRLELGRSKTRVANILLSLKPCLPTRRTFDREVISTMGTIITHPLRAGKCHMFARLAHDMRLRLLGQQPNICDAH